MSIMFNQIFINEEILPKYTYLKFYDPAVHKNRKEHRQGFELESLSPFPRKYIYIYI